MIVVNAGFPRARRIGGVISADRRRGWIIPLLVLLLVGSAPTPALPPAGPQLPGVSTAPAEHALPAFHFSCTGTGTAQVEALVRSLSRQSLMEKIRQVDRFVNSFARISDEQRFGGDRWLQPQEFFKSGGGDCEDFAIAKYWLLRRLGVPADQLYVVLLRETVERLPHAVLVVFVDRRPLVLDNDPKLGIAPLDLLTDYRPAFSMNELGRWRHRPLPAVPDG